MIFLFMQRHGGEDLLTAAGEQQEKALFEITREDGSISWVKEAEVEFLGC